MTKKYVVSEFEQPNGWSDLDKFETVEEAKEALEYYVIRGIAEKENLAVFVNTYDEDGDIVSCEPLE